MGLGSWWHLDRRRLILILVLPRLLRGALLSAHSQAMSAVSGQAIPPFTDRETEAGEVAGHAARGWQTLEPRSCEATMLCRLLYRKLHLVGGGGGRAAAPGMEGGAGCSGRRVHWGPPQGPSLLKQLCYKGRDVTKLGVLTAAGRGIGGRGRGRGRWEAGCQGGAGSALDRGVFPRQPGRWDCRVGQGEGCSQEGDQEGEGWAGAGVPLCMWSAGSPGPSERSLG